MNDVAAAPTQSAHMRLLDLPDEVLNVLPAAVYVCDLAGLICRFNRKAVELWGRAPKLGDAEDRFCGSWRLSRLDGGPLPHAQCPMADVLRTGEAVRDQEVVIERPDGSRITALVNITALRDASGVVIGAVNCFQDISDRKRMEELLRERDRESRELLDALPAAIYTTDAAGRITFYNKAAVEFSGRRPVIGSDEWCVTWRLYTTEGAKLPHDECPMAVALREGRPVRGVEAVAERPDGTRVPFIPYPAPLRDASGKLVGAVNMLVDITDRKQAEEAMQEQTRRLDSLSAISRSISGDLDLERIVQIVTDGATELSGAKFGAFFYNQTDKRGESYMLYALSGALRDDFAGFAMPRNTPLFATTFLGTGIVRADDIRADSRYGQNAPHFGMPKGHLPVVSYLAVPVVSRSGEVHGGLFLGHDQAGVFTAEAEEIVSGLAAHAAVAIDNARLVQTIQAELEQRRRAEEKTKLLVREVNHRANNMLALIGAMMRQTRADTVPDFISAMQGRINALARVQGRLARDEWDRTDLLKLVSEELAPFGRDIKGRFRIEGPAVPLEAAAAQSLAIIVHELATNAVKYGSLSISVGQVAVKWALTPDRRLALSWIESGGPRASVPARKGFGTRAITALAQQLEGKLEVEWRPEGLACRFSIPTESLFDQTGLGPVGPGRAPPGPIHLPPGDAGLREPTAAHRRQTAPAATQAARPPAVDGT